MNDYRCSKCGTKAYYDGRCGDGPILMCKCDSNPYKKENDGSYTKPIKDFDWLADRR